MQFCGKLTFLYAHRKLFTEKVAVEISESDYKFEKIQTRITENSTVGRAGAGGGKREVRPHAELRLVVVWGGGG